MNEITKYAQERNAMLKKRSVAELRKFINDHAHFYTDGFVQSFNNAKDYVVEITLHKMIANSIGLPKEMREESVQWLLDRGLNPRVV